MSIFTVMLTAAAQASSLPATASVQLGFDIQCMIASQSAVAKTEGAVKAGAQLASMFYFGRVDSVLSGAALEERMATEIKAMKGKPLGPLLQQCGGFMEQRGKTLEAIGTRLNAQEQAEKVQ